MGFIFILRMSVMKCVTLAVFMVSAQGAPQFPALDQFPQLQQFLNGLNSNGVALPPLPAWLQDIVSKLPTGTASGRADFSDEDGSSEETLKHFFGGHGKPSYGGYSKPSYGGYYGGYSNNYYNPYNTYNPYNAYNPNVANPYAVNPYAVNPYAYNGQIGTITGVNSAAGTTTGTTGTTGVVTPTRTEES